MGERRTVRAPHQHHEQGSRSSERSETVPVELGASDPASESTDALQANVTATGRDRLLKPGS